MWGLGPPGGGGGGSERTAARLGDERFRKAPAREAGTSILLGRWISGRGRNRLSPQANCRCPRRLVEGGQEGQLPSLAFWVCLALFSHGQLQRNTSGITEAGAGVMVQRLLLSADI